jgi:peptidoglycan/LPS O-acetylase OafA/YrhL
LTVPPDKLTQQWAGTAAQVVATLLLALVLEAGVFRQIEKMRRRDAISAAAVLLAAVFALIVVVFASGYDESLPTWVGALVVGASVSLTWVVLTDVLHWLFVRALHPDRVLDRD